jgi:hypothetical protein
MRANPASFEPFIEDNGTLGAHLARVEKLGEEMGELELFAVTRVYERDVYIHRMTGDVVGRYSGGESSHDPMHFAFTQAHGGGGHYDVVRYVDLAAAAAWRKPAGADTVPQRYESLRSLGLSAARAAGRDPHAATAGTGAIARPPAPSAGPSLQAQAHDAPACPGPAPVLVAGGPLMAADPDAEDYPEGASELGDGEFQDPAPMPRPAQPDPPPPMRRRRRALGSWAVGVRTLPWCRPPPRWELPPRARRRRLPPYK